MLMNMIGIKAKCCKYFIKNKKVRTYILKLKTKAKLSGIILCLSVACKLIYRHRRQELIDHVRLGIEYGYIGCVIK